MYGNLYSHFTGLVSRDTRPALIGHGEDGYSFAGLDQLSAQIAGKLCDFGVKPGERVAVKVEKTPQALALYLACLRLGAIYLPMNTAYTPDEVAYILADATPAVFVHDPNEEHPAPCIKATLDAAGRGTLMDAPSSAFDAVFDADEDTIAAILYTSGTTGRPKGAMLSHGNLCSNAETLAQAWRFSADDVLLHALPIFHAHGLFVAINIALVVGCPMIFLPRFDADTVVRALPNASVYMGVPTHYVRLLKHPGFDRQTAAHMRLFVSGSAPLLPETFDSFERRTGQKILERYGMTETVMNCSNPYDGPRVAGTVGPALPGIVARVTDEEGREVPRGDIGVLEIRGPNVFKGYWNKPEVTAKAFRDDGFFITGDLAQMDEGGVVRLVGRANDMIITGGFNVYPLEIEDVLNAQTGVDESAVIGIPHPDFGEAVIAILTGSGADEATLKAACLEKLANYKVPKRFIFTSDLPRNTMGKVEKAKLRKAYAGLFQS